MITARQIERRTKAQRFSCWKLWFASQDERYCETHGALPGAYFHLVMRISLTSLIQCSLLKYSEFEPPEQPPENGKRKKDSDVSSDRTKLNSSSPSPSHKSRWLFKRKGKKPCNGQQDHELSPLMANSNARDKEHEKAPKRIPVVFFDEAHKLWVHLPEDIY